MMKHLQLLFCVVLGCLGGVLCAAPATPEAAKTALAEALKKSDYTFTPAIRQAYVEYAEAVVRAKYGPTKINAATWAWLEKRPQVMSAVAAAEYPINPNILLNFQRLGWALGPQRLDQWRQLALAYAIRYRDTLFPIDDARDEWNPARLERAVSEMRKGKGGDFALISEEAYPKVSEEERRLGEWIAGPQTLGLTRPPLTIPELMNMPLHEINMIVRKLPDEPPMLTRFPNWDNVALGGRIHPPHVDGTPTPQRAVLMKIFRNGRIPAKSNRPNFRMERAEWPILLYVADLAEVDETSFIFNYFVTNKEIPPLGMGQKKSSTGGNDINANDPNFKYARSNWHPKKFIRIYNGSKKDQGGRSWAWGLNAVNVAATAVAAPPDGKFYFMGERGAYTYHLTCADNAFTGLGSSADWYLSAPATVDNANPFAKGAGTFSSSGGNKVLHLNFIGLAATLNQGLQEYEDARMALGIIELMGLPKGRCISLLESLFLRNPLNPDIAYRLAAEYRSSNDLQGTLRMLTAMRAYAALGLKLPVSQGSVKNARAAALKAFKAKEPTYQGLPVVSVNQSPWFFLLCSDIAIQYLRDNGGGAQSGRYEGETPVHAKEALRPELDYLRSAAEGCGDKPILRAIETLQELVR